MARTFSSSYSSPLAEVKTKALRTLLEKDDRIIGFSIEKDEGRVFIYTDSSKWCDGAGSGTFSGSSETQAVRCFKAEVQSAETPEQEAEAIWTRSTTNERIAFLIKAGILTCLSNYPFTRFGERNCEKLTAAILFQFDASAEVTPAASAREVIADAVAAGPLRVTQAGRELLAKRGITDLSRVVLEDVDVHNIAILNALNSLVESTKVGHANWCTIAGHLVIAVRDGHQFYSWYLDGAPVSRAELDAAFNVTPRDAAPEVV